MTRELTHFEYLNRTVWAKLGASKIHGIGVIAIRDIPKGTRITDHSVHNMNESKELLTVHTTDFFKILPEIRALILDRMSFPPCRVFAFYSPNTDACLQSFMNHDSKPNTDGVHALRLIHAGEELTEDYRRHGDAHPLIKDHRKFLW